MVLHDSPWHAAQWSCQHKETHSLHNLHNIELFSRNPKYSLEAVSFFVSANDNGWPAIPLA
jgi:hypothetical protein